MLEVRALNVDIGAIPAGGFTICLTSPGLAMDCAPGIKQSERILVINPDVEQAADVIRPMLALYVGGMGAKGANFHYEVLARIGYEAECATIQELYLDGRKGEAIAAVPLQMVEDVALVGSVEKVRDELAKWEETVITELLVQGPPELLRVVADIAS